MFLHGPGKVVKHHRCAFSDRGTHLQNKTEWKQVNY